MTFQYFENPFSQQDLSAWMNCESGPVGDHIILEPTTVETVEFPHRTIPCTLVASNQAPGFGASCTQEELVTGSCPPLLLLGALLIAPHVPANVSLLAYGKSSITHWRGQGRQAHSLGESTVADHTFLLIDASELDNITDSPTDILDLHPRYFLRDLNKAYTGFLALCHLQIQHISSPLWGAGAFSGDPVIKAVILAIAAARAGIIVHLTIDKERSYKLTDIDASTDVSTTVLSALQIFKQHPTLTVRGTVLHLTSREIATCPNGLDVIRNLAR